MGIIEGLTSFSTMIDLAKSMKDINDAAARNSVAIDLQEKILTAQSERTSLIEKIRTLEERVADLEAWDADKKRYELKEFDTGQFAYALKEKTGAGEPPHMLCANCYNQNQKSILQTEMTDVGRHKLTYCQNCGSDLFSPNTGGRPKDPPRRNPRG